MEFIQKNNINIAIEDIKDTPRSAFYLYFSTEKALPYDGTDIILGNLLLQGTDEKTAEQIAAELENLGIEISIDSSVDFLKISILCLNEDIEKALELTKHFVTKANFKTFDKEIFKFKGEVTALLDSPARKASDKFYREIFKDHKYGVTNTKILENIDGLKPEHISEHYKNLLSGRKIISVAMDVKNKDEILNLICSHLDFMQEKNSDKQELKTLKHDKKGIFKIVKDDAKQAQIFQGWITDGIESEDCAPLTVLNNILGASGLSSRLFVELRDRKGLAYTVRSTYKTLKDGAVFMLYIGTEPSNIKKSLEGFKTEIQRIIDEPPTDEEILGAKESYVGKFKYLYTQTNAQIARTNGWNYITGLDFNYNERFLEKIKAVTLDDILKVTKKYLQKEPVTVILAPSDYLNF